MRLSVISANIWYYLTWQMTLDIIMCITFFLFKRNSQLPVLYARILKKTRYIDNQ